MQGAPRDILVRRAQAADYVNIRRLALALYAFHHRKAPDRIKPIGAIALTRPDFARVLGDPTQGVFVAERAQRVIGYVYAKMQNLRPGPQYHPRRICYIAEVMIGPRSRRIGAARALMQAAETWAAQQKAESVEVDVFAFNDDARGFYTALGFSELALRFAKPQ